MTGRPAVCLPSTNPANAAWNMERSCIMRIGDRYGEHVQTKYTAVHFPESTHMFIRDYPEKFVEEVSKLLQQ